MILISTHVEDVVEVLVRKSPENKLSWVSGLGGWLYQVVIRLSQLSTKLKLELSYAIASHGSAQYKILEIQRYLN